jgi:hypothetical protein
VSGRPGELLLNRRSCAGGRCFGNESIHFYGEPARRFEVERLASVLLPHGLWVKAICTELLVEGVHLLYAVLHKADVNYLGIVHVRHTENVVRAPLSSLRNPILSFAGE